tara:strand:+ start:1303 stop:1566 length:264 start_codon:yes stop_codon:yes gene_type:complete
MKYKFNRDSEIFKELYNLVSDSAGFNRIMEAFSDSGYDVEDRYFLKELVSYDMIHEGREDLLDFLFYYGDQRTIERELDDLHDLIWG